MSKLIAIEKFEYENHVYYRTNVEEMGDAPHTRYKCGGAIALKNIKEVNDFIKETKEEFSHSSFDIKLVNLGVEALLIKK